MAIISWSKKFIFIKTRKTAGTSMEVELASRCTAEDIVTPIFPPNQHHSPRNYEGVSVKFYNHMPATEIMSLIGEEKFARAFKFCFERHPVDKCLSFYAMLRNSPHHRDADHPASWEEYLERGNFPNDDKLYRDELGSLIIDQIYRYDELGTAWVDICRRLDLPPGNIEASEKSGFRYGVPTFDQVMASPDQRNLIMDAFSASVELLKW